MLYQGAVPAPRKVPAECALLPRMLDFTLTGSIFLPLVPELSRDVCAWTAMLDVLKAVCSRVRALPGYSGPDNSCGTQIFMQDGTAYRARTLCSTCNDWSCPGDAACPGQDRLEALAVEPAGAAGEPCRPGTDSTAVHPHPRLDSSPTAAVVLTLLDCVDAARLQTLSPPPVSLLAVCCLRRLCRRNDAADPGMPARLIVCDAVLALLTCCHLDETRLDDSNKMPDASFFQPTLIAARAAWLCQLYGAHHLNAVWGKPWPAPPLAQLADVARVHAWCGAVPCSRSPCADARTKIKSFILSPH